MVSLQGGNLTVPPWEGGMCIFHFKCLIGSRATETASTLGSLSLPHNTLAGNWECLKTTLSGGTGTDNVSSGGGVGGEFYIVVAISGKQHFYRRVKIVLHLLPGCLQRSFALQMITLVPFAPLLFAQLLEK